MLGTLLQATPQVVHEIPPWLTTIIGSGTVGGMLSLVLYWVFTKMIPRFIEATDKQRDSFLAATERQRTDAVGILEKQRQLDREDAQKQRALDREENLKSRLEFFAALEKLQVQNREDLRTEREERKASAEKLLQEQKSSTEKIVDSIDKQTEVLSKLAGNGTIPLSGK